MTIQSKIAKFCGLVIVMFDQAGVSTELKTSHAEKTRTRIWDTADSFNVLRFVYFIYLYKA